MIGWIKSMFKTKLHANVDNNETRTESYESILLSSSVTDCQVDSKLWYNP